MGKQKNINEDVGINFRISKALKEEIKTQAKDKNITVSKYLRVLLDDVHSGIYCDEIDQRGETERFVYSKEFISLTVWIYSKSRNRLRLDSDSDEKIHNFIRIIKRADSYLPSNLVLELDKVLIDLYRIKDASIYDNKEFKFVNSYKQSNNLDFQILEDFFLNYS